MKVIQYLREVKGVGVIATSDSDGNINTAVYSRPHVIDDQTIAFIMLDRLTHKNLLSNPRASFMFFEEGERFKGVRLNISKIREEKNSELLHELRRVKYPEDDGKTRYLVFFKIDKVLPLIGSDTSSLPY